MTGLLAFLKGPWGIGGGQYGYGGVVARQSVRDFRPTRGRTAEEDELDELAAYGGYLVAESIPLEFRAAIAVAPQALEACLRLVDEHLPDRECSLCEVTAMAGEHKKGCHLGLAYHVARRFLWEFERSLRDAKIPPDSASYLTLAALKQRLEPSLTLPADVSEFEMI